MSKLNRKYERKYFGEFFDQSEFERLKEKIKDLPESIKDRRLIEFAEKRKDKHS